MSAEERLKALRKAPPDGWIAFSEDESSVVAYGLTYEQVVAAAQEKGVSEPILVKVPKDWTAMVMTA